MCIRDSSFDTWLSSTSGHKLEGNSLIISVPNNFVAEMLDQRMYSIISLAVEQVLGRTTDIKFSVIVSDINSEKPIYNNHHPDETVSKVINKPAFYKKSWRTFQNFIVGDSNKLAHAASLSVAENPGSAYNPLFIYSGVGLGKTHLLTSIASFLNNSGSNAIYVTAEEFTNEYIGSIRFAKTDHFRNKYRHIDALLIDDIQFIAGKEQTQEGFFHTFNALHMANKQIVVTSDRPVSSLNVLEQRITSRLAGGLVADMQPPPFETRLAILQEKSNKMDCDVPSDVLEYLARRVQSNVRDLEGSLNRVIAWSQFRESSISLNDVTILIGESWATMRGKTITDTAVISAVSEHFGIATDQIRGKGRRKMTVLSRQVAMYLLREETDLSFTAIGKILGGRDHSTVLHGHERVSVKIEQDDSLRNDVIKIRHSLMGKF